MKPRIEHAWANAHSPRGGSGFTPAISTYLIQMTGNRAVAGVWLMIAAACSLVATLLAWRVTTHQHHPAGVTALRAAA